MAPAVVAGSMSSDVHIGGKGGKHRAGGYDGYYAEDEDQHDWWEGQEYAGYDEWAEYQAAQAGGEWDHFEVNLYSMVFSLDDNLEPPEPQEMSKAFELDQKSFVLHLQEEDLDEASPPAWKSRPLKIHPEPLPRIERQTSAPSLPAGGLAGPGGADAGTTPTALSPLAQTMGSSPGTSPRELLQQTPLLPTPRSGSEAPAPPGAEPSLSPSSRAETPGSAAAGAGGPQSPKIVISNLQLDQLKKKMEFLKQKRSTPGAMPAMVLPPAAEEEKDPAAEDGRKPAVTSNCPLAHGLKMFKTPDEGWWCSVCERGHKKHSVFFGCRLCDYDECEECARAPVKPKKDGKDGKEAEAKPAKPKNRVSKAAKPASSQEESSPEERSPSPKASPPPKKASKAKAAEKSPSPKAASARKSATKEKRRESSPPARAGTPPSTRHKKRREEEKEPSTRKEKEARREAPPPARREGAEKGRSKVPGAGLAAAALAAAGTANRKSEAAATASAAAAAASEDESSSEERERPPPKRAARENKLVPRGRKAAQPEHWEESRSRKDVQEDSDQSPSPVRGPSGPGAALAAAVRSAAAGQRRASLGSVRLERRTAPDRPAARRGSWSRDRGSSEEPPPKKRASGSSSAAVAADDPPSRGSAASSAPARTAAPRRREQGDNLLQRVLRAHGGPTGKRSAPGGGGAGGGDALKEHSPPPREPAPKPKPPANREPREPRDPVRGATSSIRKALQDIATQEDGRGARRAR